MNKFVEYTSEYELNHNCKINILESFWVINTTANGVNRIKITTIQLKCALNK